jgi:hypothetical protein
MWTPTVCVYHVTTVYDRDSFNGFAAVAVAALSSVGLAALVG